MRPAPEKAPPFGTLGTRRDTARVVVRQIMACLVAAVMENVTVTNTVRTPAPSTCHTLDEKVATPTPPRRPASAPATAPCPPDEDRPLYTPPLTLMSDGPHEAVRPFYASASRPRARTGSRPRPWALRPVAALLGKPRPTVPVAAAPAYHKVLNDRLCGRSTGRAPPATAPHGPDTAQTSTAGGHPAPPALASFPPLVYLKWLSGKLAYYFLFGAGVRGRLLSGGSPRRTIPTTMTAP